MSINRRQFLTTLGLTTIATHIAPVIAEIQTSPNIIIKPPHLKIGDTVGLIAPAGIIEPKDIETAQQALSKLGLKVITGAHILDRHGYLAGKDSDRAQDIHTMFADNSVKAIMAMRGGWGCNRILPLLNYPLIRKNPKIIIGYSDITSLLLAINARSRLITFHGAVATSTWNQFTIDYFKNILFDGEKLIMQNTPTNEGKIAIINQGKARGKLIGGNLSILAAMVGSPYLPSWHKSILFLEDIGEDIYRIDRMLTQLKNAGILNQISGFIFGQCTNCQPGDEPSFTLIQILKHHIQPLGIPAWYGSMIGHIKDKFTVPIGLEVEIDTDNGTIKMLEAAVT
ncbi:LD-carboxypeptidase [Anabaena cylindrica FACHB-243]|uniref:Peptidase U61 LD-carboxypeptidase A n=1 Tax=Anabaena cylindrica (strain ATCC 27899 / PCC 7122) TaxID=272123 RepID=K9ZFV7_ANACC|nr:MULTISPECIES: LD-carboxypeptidase [Anabaena]AFZ57215.1 peptidase U61 LD-carboxypeptidase A [Anabaena cylindrica PCC 7122]MBD2420886.1 LD-carboxypeptidase [Anabaena cylindrica FACHB-243]MBY5285816.1 LD-carboxypeptidase [Anabaena sp. CCAP 1446/1C]MBY5309214.1 LD-carboxypeptidase [Anabaena sp. CCAP 1446/1C]MCM2405635.1 LD-carboxypeptidase [Anabaena sp. CCAP 1446/1C]